MKELLSKVQNVFGIFSSDFCPIGMRSIISNPPNCISPIF